MTLLKCIKWLQIFVLAALLPTFCWAQTKYFQQQSDHEIHVRLDDGTHQLHAFQTIGYTNNSPDVLTEIWFHLWPNAYQRGSALDYQMRETNDVSLFFSRAEDRGYMDSLNFNVDGQPVVTRPHHKHKDIVLLVLNAPLPPGGRISITTPFRVQIPKGIFSRLGHLGQAYQVTQWFPKPAVYDNTGWHAMPYLGQGEFYSEFGTYDVHITLPKNYVVGATGDLVDGEEELKWLNERAVQTAAIKDFNSRDLSFPTSDSENKTLHYHQERVHDFAWFADKRYHVLKGEVALPISKQKVTTWAMFTNNEADLWKDAITYLNDAATFYSVKVGEYPYSHLTAVDGVLSEGGGMEYPNITIIGESGTAKGLEETIMHEVGHNWFYGMLASNERQHPWMDEGMNTFIQMRYMENKYPKLLVRNTYAQGKLARAGLRILGLYDMEHNTLGNLSYRISARLNADQPMELPSEKFTSTNYGIIAYQKSAAVLTYLQSYLGEAKMDTLMHRYFRKWRYRHPAPADFRDVAMQVANDSLSWFFDGLVNSDNKLDYGVTNARLKGDSLQIRVRNLGFIAAPFPVSVMKNDMVQQTRWFEGSLRPQWVTVACDSCDAVVIDASSTILDVNLKNNAIQVSGFFKDMTPLRAHFVAFVEADSKHHIAFAPLIGGNKYDGFMLGMAVYNDILPKNRLSYTLMPMYAFGSKSIAGMADVHYTFYQKKQYPSVRIGISGQRFTIDQRPNLPQNILRPEIALSFRPENRRLNMDHRIRLRVNIFLKENDGSVAQSIPQLTYVMRHALKPHSTQVTADMQWFDGHTRISLEAIYGFAFRRSRGFRARFFIGKIFRESFDPAFNFRMASHRGYNDYLYEGAFLGRNETNGFFAQQMIEADGGFKTYMNIGASNKWLTSLNLSSTLYRKIPLELFLSIGVSANTGTAFPGSETFLVEFGASLNVIPDILAVHFPFVLSGDVKDNVNLLTSNYWERIRFTFNINAIKPRARLQAFFQ